MEGLTRLRGVMGRVRCGKGGRFSDLAFFVGGAVPEAGLVANTHTHTHAHTFTQYAQYKILQIMVCE